MVGLTIPEFFELNCRTPTRLSKGDKSFYAQ
jgi:hypothetical protein